MNDMGGRGSRFKPHGLARLMASASGPGPAAFSASCSAARPARAGTRGMQVNRRRTP